MTHGQDVEFQLVNVRKTEDGSGRLDGVLTFRHGYMNVWHPDPKIQEHMRGNLGANLKKSMDVLNMSFGPMYQPHAIRHGISRPSFIADDQGAPAGMITYSPRFGHAQMAGNMQRWAQGYGDGVVLIPENQNYNFESPLAGTSSFSAGILPYKIESWQQILDTYGTQPDFFANEASQEERVVADGRARVRKGLPAAIAADGGIATTLPIATWGRSPHPFAFPNEILQFLTNGLDPSERPPSSAYIYNPDIEMVSP